MKVYISCPLTESLERLDMVVNRIRELGYEALYYKRGTEYSREDLESADIFVLVGGYDMDVEALSSGCRKEFKYARNTKGLYFTIQTTKGLKIHLMSDNKLRSENRITHFPGKQLEACKQIHLEIW